MSHPIDKFQTLLRELFQFDCADLDFGIYRIMNYKRGVIEKFISTDLPETVAKELGRGALAEQSQAAAELKEVAGQIRETLGTDALDADGHLAEAYHATPLGKKHLSLKARAAGGRGRDALEAAIFNHLYAFFSRYYQDGDFISKRRYSKRERYAIPYNGEEVYLYWANHDQYYIKTGEYFTDYTWKAPNGVTVHFKLQQADVEQNNVKGDKRFFLPRLNEIAWDERAGQVVIPFEYRPLTEQEDIAYGKKNQQDAIIAEALDKIPRRLTKADQALAALTAERRKNAEGQPVTFLEHHLRQYTRRNTSDFFIHKDLKGFLSRELDFYLKNEVLNLDEMEAAGGELAEGWFQMVRVIKAVGGQIIDFLDQIERFQKMLWEKRKFITVTQYCITVGNIAGSFYGDIAACEAQWAEWKELFHIDEEQADLFTSGKSRRDRRIAFLKAHPTLVLDTKHFDRDFVDRLLASYEDLDGMTDGLLVHSENWQALNLLLENYRGQVKCIYIDPPYNTSATKILYKNNYEHSSWLSLMDSRLLLAKNLLRHDGVLAVTIDDYEGARLQLLLDYIMGGWNRLGNIVVVHNPGGRHDDKFVATAHEYVFLYGLDVSHTTTNLMPLAEKDVASFKYEDKEGRYRIREFRRSGSNSTREARPMMYYPILYRAADDTLHIVDAAEYARVYDREKNLFDDEYVKTLRKKYEDRGFRFILPIDPKGIKRVWRWAPKTFLERRDEVFATRISGRIELKVKDRLKNKAGLKPKSVWNKPKYSAALGTNLLKDILGAAGLFSYPKGLDTVMDVIRVSANSEDTIFDFFAGSGTTGHAVINLNCEDGGSRKFILVEMADYFDTVLLPRIKKVTFMPEWKDGKPKRMATTEEAERSPRIVKYIRLESYEDALNNIEFDEASGQQALKFEDYLLKYMLRWETRASDTLLNVEKLARLFSYNLHIHADGQTREKVVDVPETFNYLLGLEVQTRKAYDDNGRRYLVYRGKTRDSCMVVVIWRETEGWKKEDYERDEKFVTEQKLTDGADEVFVNGDSFIPNARALEPVFKARMFAPVEV